MLQAMLPVKRIGWLVPIFVFLLLIGRQINAAETAVAQSTATTTADLLKADAYQAIVQIKTFVLNENYDLAKQAVGSGVVINQAGLILTNNHVIEAKDDFDNSDLKAGYQICLPQNATDEPDCSYAARLLVKNKDLDIALLQIINIAGLSDKISYPFLELNQEDNTNNNDEVTAIGYPAIGGGTITITKGIVSGKTEKYGKKWIKTDAVISFGSSGGAAIDKNGKVIGITSAGHSDFLGSLGYIINITSINGWISDNKDKQAKDGGLEERVIALAKDEKGLKIGNTASHANPAYSITKPADWEFNYENENILTITKESDDDGGYIVIYAEKYPHALDMKNIIPFLKYSAAEKGTLSFLNIVQDKEVKINGRAMKKILMSNGDGPSNFYAVPYGNWLITILYNYGQDDKDKAIIDKTINSFKLKGPVKPLPEQKKYSNTNPDFSLTASQDWAILPKNSKNKPLIILNKRQKEIRVRFSLNKFTDNTRNLTNKDLITQYKKTLEQVNKLSGVTDVKFELVQSNDNYKLNKKVSGCIKTVTQIKSASTKKILAYNINYTKKINSKYALDIILISTNPDKKNYQAVVKEFDKMLESFSLVKLAGTADSDNDGLSDEREKKYGTDPKNQDSDGDGYIDGEEVKSGYNPLGPGKLITN